jgi:hypothetical protein
MNRPAGTMRVLLYIIGFVRSTLYYLLDADPLDIDASGPNPPSFGSVALSFVGLSVIRFSPAPHKFAPDVCSPLVCSNILHARPKVAGRRKKIKSLLKVGSVLSAVVALTCKSVNKILKDFPPKGVE